MSMIVLASVLALALLTTMWLENGARARRSLVISAALHEISAALGRRPEWDEDAIIGRLKEAEEQLETLPRKWDQIKREASAAETRARYHARRALDELEERGLTSPGLEAVAGELFENDERPGEIEPLSPVHQGVEDYAQPDDWYSQAMRHKYGSSRNN